MTYQKIQDAIDNYINGNISDTKKAIQRMTKVDLLEFMQMFEETTSKHSHEVIRITKTLLR